MCFGKDSYQSRSALLRKFAGVTIAQIHLSRDEHHTVCFGSPQGRSEGLNLNWSLAAAVSCARPKSCQEERRPYIRFLEKCCCSCSYYAIYCFVLHQSIATSLFATSLFFSILLHFGCQTILKRYKSWVMACFSFSECSFSGSEWTLFFHPYPAPPRIKLSFHLTKFSFSWFSCLTHGYSSALLCMNQLRAPESTISVMPFRNAVCSANFWKDSLVIFCKDTNETQKILPWSLQSRPVRGGALLACFPGSDFINARGSHQNDKREAPNHKGEALRTN